MDLVGKGDMLVADTVVIDEVLVEGPGVVGGATIKDSHLTGD